MTDTPGRAPADAPVSPTADSVAPSVAQGLVPCQPSISPGSPELLRSHSDPPSPPPRVPTRSAARTLGWLPGLQEAEIERWETLTFGESADRLDLWLPLLTTEGLAAQAERVAAARDGYLANLPVARVVELLDRVASRWLDPSSPYRREAELLLPTITGYSEPAIRKGLPSFLASLRAENLTRLLEEELPDPRVLDEFHPRLTGAGGETRAFGPRLTVHVWSGNVPGLPAQSLVSALLVKSASLGKVSSHEPLFATLLAESIAEVDPSLAECLAVAWWPGGSADREAAVFGAADAVIAYGSDAAIEAVRGQIPSATRFIPYGHKLSFGVVGREALGGATLMETARLAAYDVSKYDQQGCLSPHLFYVEHGGEHSPQQFARALGEALAGFQEQVPRGRLSLEERANVAAVRQRYELRQAAGEAVELVASEGGGWAVLYDEDATFEASCLNRTVYVKPIAELLADVPPLASPVKRYLQTCGVAASPERRRELAGQLGRLGLDRVCPLGRMADVAATWHHDGRTNLLELLRWTDLEPEASAGRWELANPERGLYGR